MDDFSNRPEKHDDAADTMLADELFHGSARVEIGKRP